MSETSEDVTGIASMMECVLNVSKELRRVRKTWNTATDELIALQNDLTEVEVLLQRVQSVSQRRIRAENNDDLASEMQQLAKKASNILSSLEEFVSDMSNATEVQRKRVWRRWKTNVYAKRVEVCEVRAKMREALGLCKTDLDTRTQFEIHRIESSMAIQHQVLQELKLLSLRSTESHRLPLGKLACDVEQSLACHGSGSYSVTSMDILKTAQDGCKPRSTPALPSTISVFGTYRTMDSQCDDGCACRCHFATKKDSPLAWDISHVLRRIVGIWIASHGSSTAWFQGCNTTTCRQQSSTTYQVQYEFPLWLPTWTVKTIIQKRMTELSTVLLKVRHRVRYRGSLHHFCHANEPNVIQRYVQLQPGSVATRLHDGASPLLESSRSCTSSMPACLEVLINAGASLHDEDRYGISAAKHIAAYYADGTYGRKLREQLACRLPLDEMIEDLDLSPITEVILGLRTDDVKSLLSKLTEWDLDMNELDRVGRSPLHWAARQGDCYVVDQLISHGADPNIANITKTTPLMEVAASSTSIPEAKVKCAKLLISAGAELKKEDIFGQTAFYIACYGVNTAALVKLMLKHEKWKLYAENWDGELAYSQVQDPSVIKYLVTKGLDIDHGNHFGRSSLMAAVFAQRTQSCKILLELGADVKLVDDDGMTILHVAAKGADAATMKLLTDWKMEGVDPDALDTAPPPYKAKKYFARRKCTAKSEVTAFSRLSWSARRGYKSGLAKKANDAKRVEEAKRAEEEDEVV